MIDAPGRVTPRFPAYGESAAREMIRAAIIKETEGNPSGVVGVAGGSAGGDLLFHEVCDELGIESHLFLAMSAREFFARSVQYAGADWARRFWQLSARRTPRVLQETADLPAWLRSKSSYSVWQRNNAWLLFNALSFDEASVTL